MHHVSPVLPAVSPGVIHGHIKPAPQINNNLSVGPGLGIYGMEVEQRCCLWAAGHWERCHYFEVDLAQRLVLDKDQQPTATRPTAASVVTGRFFTVINHYLLAAWMAWQAGLCVSVDGRYSVEILSVIMRAAHAVPQRHWTTTHIYRLKQLIECIL